MRILACQIDVPAMGSAAERDAHVELVAHRIDEALTRQQADIVVLPELSTIEYSAASFDCLDALAEPLEGPG